MVDIETHFPRCDDFQVVLEAHSGAGVVEEMRCPSDKSKKPCGYIKPIEGGKNLWFSLPVRRWQGGPGVCPSLLPAVTANVKALVGKSCIYSINNRGVVNSVQVWEPELWEEVFPYYRLSSKTQPPLKGGVRDTRQTLEDGWWLLFEGRDIWRLRDSYPASTHKLSKNCRLERLVGDQWLPVASDPRVTGGKNA